ncbi:MAG TPA: hypothetical protein PKZ12_02830, partial [Smithellaceae bacterium]|nr:hypothetical protein [Smithellaceae bacterium]
MLYRKMIIFLYNFLLAVLQCRIFIGCRPSTVNAPAVIFFPFIPGQLNCGFAGLMTCRLPNRPAVTTADFTVAALWKKIKSAGLQTISTRKNNAADYLGGRETIAAVAMAVAELKREDVQEFLFFQKDRVAALAVIAGEMKQLLADEEKLLDKQTTVINSVELEIINSRLLLIKDIGWMLEYDILSNLQKVLALTGAADTSLVKPASFRKYRKLNLLLNALDRLEVRGRDSAGIQLTFTINDEKEMTEINRIICQNKWLEDYQRRTQKGDLINHSIAIAASPNNGAGKTSITFTYKTFSVVGELGRNVAQLRNDIQNDRILQCFADAETFCETALAHTRWASVGSISEDNCHPVNNFTTNQGLSVYPLYPGTAAEINVVLNGDIDNYPALRQDLEAGAAMIAPQITTDTKIIPLQIEKYLQAGENLTCAFRLAVNDFAGSHAIAMTSNLEPGKTFLALRGSGQSIYVGISNDQYLFSSELYGVVEVMPHFLRMNGEAGHGAAAGQIFVLDQDGGGSQGISAFFYDGAIMQLTDDELQTAEITT